MGTADPVAREEHPRATVNRDADGEPLGVTLFLGADDLARLGLDADDVDWVAYWPEDGAVSLAPESADE